eukprot:315301_1
MGIQVFVRMCSILTIDVEPNDTILTVKKKVLEQNGVPPHEVWFVFGCKMLNDDHFTLSDYNIQKASTIEGNIRFHSELSVVIKVNSDEFIYKYLCEHFCPIYETETIQTLKNRIANYLGENKDEFNATYNLLYNDKILQPDFEYFSNGKFVMTDRCRFNCSLKTKNGNVWYKSNRNIIVREKFNLLVFGFFFVLELVYG